MILTAQSPANGLPAIPLSFLEELGRVMSQHKAVRLVPEDEAVTVEEAAKVLEVQVQFIREMLHLGVLKRAEGNGSAVVRLDSLLDYRRSRPKRQRDGLDDVFEELAEKCLY